MRFPDLRSLGGAVLLIAAAAPRAIAQTPPCCSITALEPRTQTATATVTATRQSFIFKVGSAMAWQTLRVGQPVYANFPAKQVSLDGKAACCAILSVGLVPVATTNRGTAVVPNTAAAPVAKGAVIGVVNPAFASSILALTVDPNGAGGMEAHGSVIVGTTASTNPQDAIRIDLTSSNPQLVKFTNPAIAVVQPGTSLAKFTFLSVPVWSPTTVSITATWGSSKSTEPFTILPQALIGFRVAPTTIASATKAVGTLLFSGPPAPGSAVVTLKTSNPAVVQVPATVVVPANRTQVDFDLHAGGAGASTPVDLTATFGYSAPNVPLSLTTSVTVWPLSLTVDGTCNSPCRPNPHLTVKLPAPAPPGGLTLYFSHLDNSIQFPQGDAINIPAGDTAGSIEVQYDGGNFSDWPARSFPVAVSYNGHLFHSHGLMVWPQGKPDLTIWKAVVSDRFANDISTTGPVDGQPFTVCAVVSQVGANPDDPWMSHWLTEPVHATTVRVSDLNNHGAGHDFTLPIDLSDNYQGYYWVRTGCTILPGLDNVNDYYDVDLIVDPDHKVNETNEGNNERKLRITRKK